MNEFFFITFIVGVFLIYWYRDQPYFPKKIWMYWDNPDVPKIVAKCIRRIKQFNPRDEVVLLTKKTYKGYVTIPEELYGNPNFTNIFSDLVRLWILTEHGGIWVDASTIVNESFDWVFPWYYPETKEFSGFYLESVTDKNKLLPIIQSWFLACVKGSSFIRLWRDEFSRIGNFPSVDGYINACIHNGIDMQNNRDPSAIHVAAQKILQIDRYPLDRLILRKAEDGEIYQGSVYVRFTTKIAPFAYLVRAKWDSEKALSSACMMNYPMMTLRDADRLVLDRGYHQCFFTDL